MTALPADASPATYLALFRELAPQPLPALAGRYDARFIGPGWYRALFGALLVAGGLRGWTGKEFQGGVGVNLCRRGARVVRRSRLVPAEPPAPSTVDGRPALLLRYRERSRLALVRDELRRHPDGTLLGVTYLELPPLRWIKLPFAIAPVP